MPLSESSERELVEVMSPWIGWGSFYPVVAPLLESRDNAIAERDRRIAELEKQIQQINMFVGRFSNV